MNYLGFLPLILNVFEIHPLSLTKRQFLLSKHIQILILNQILTSSSTLKQLIHGIQILLYDFISISFIQFYPLSPPILILLFRLIR